jgi:benzoate 4-monooxygenase
LPEKLEALHDQLGPVIRIGPNDISFQSAAAIGPIYKSGRRVVKSEFYDGFTTFHPNVFGTRDEEVRRKSAPLHTAF